MEDLKRRIEKYLSQPDNIDRARVERVLRDYDSNEDDWALYALRPLIETGSVRCNLNKAKLTIIEFHCRSYTRTMLMDRPEFNLLVLVWPPKSSSPIHDHSNAKCFVKILSGSLTEIRYADDGIEKTSVAALPVNGVSFIEDAMGLHEMRNESEDKFAVSLHVYCPKFKSCNVFKDGVKQKAEMKVWKNY